MRIANMSAIFLVSASAIPLFFSQTAAAQTATAQPATTATEAPGELGDIVVTARKTEEALQDVPVALTALSGAALQQQTVQSVHDLQFHVPGFVSFPEAQGGAPDFAIRGAKQQGISGSQGGVATYLDYVPITSNYSVASANYDMQSVQVLKGPQGTLFGKNTTGGAVIFSPNKPVNHFETSGTVGYGNYNRMEFTGMVNLPITDGVALRLSGRVVARDGYIKNLGGADLDNEDNQSFRAILRLQPIDGLTSDTMFDYYHQSQHPNPFRALGVYDNGLICTIYAGDCVGGRSNAFEKANNLPLRTVDLGSTPLQTKGTYWGISNQTSFEVADNFTIRNIFGYRKDKLNSQEENDGTYLPILFGRNNNRTRQFTDELDFIGKLFDEKLSYTIGLYYADYKFNQNSNYDILSIAPGLGGLPSFPFTLNGATINPAGPSVQINTFASKSKAIFGQLEYQIDEKLSVTAGARYNREKLRFNSQQYSGFTDFTLATARCNILVYADPSELVGPCELARSRTFNSFTWSASLNYKVDPKTLIYVSAGRGYQAGGFNQQIREVQYRTYSPETVFNVELGLKKDWRLADRPLRTNLAVFRSSYKDQQRVENGAYSDGVNFIGTFNAANAVIWGGEAQIDYLPTRRVSLSVGYSYINAQYENFLTPNIGAFSGSPRDLSGLAIAATPKHTVNGTASYDLPIGSEDGKARFSLSGYYRSGTYYQDLIQNPYTFQDGYALLNGRIDLLDLTKVNIGFWMNNITNKTYYLFKNDTRGSLGWVGGFLGAPRTYGMDVSFKF